MVGAHQRGDQVEAEAATVDGRRHGTMDHGQSILMTEAVPPMVLVTELPPGQARRPLLMVVRMALLLDPRRRHTVEGIAGVQRLQRIKVVAIVRITNTEAIQQQVVMVVQVKGTVHTMPLHQARTYLPQLPRQ
jgi:hypothetical protein